MRAAAALAADAPEAANAPVVVVRRHAVPLEAVPQQQRDDLRRHLLSLQDEVASCTDGPDGSPVEPPAADAAPVGSLLAQVCACCTGHCCRLGNGRHAFLDAPAMRAAQQAAPGRTYAQLVDDYLAAVPALHHADSCAFHAGDGCTLPRPRRAAICNEYLCPALEQTREQALAHGIARVFVVRHDAPTDRADGDFAPPLAPDRGKSGR